MTDRMFIGEIPQDSPIYKEHFKKQKELAKEIIDKSEEFVIIGVAGGGVRCASAVLPKYIPLVCVGFEKWLSSISLGIEKSKKRKEDEKDSMRDL